MIDPKLRFALSEDLILIQLNYKLWSVVKVSSMRKLEISSLFVDQTWLVDSALKIHYMKAPFNL